jgi:hypothetical protein
MLANRIEGSEAIASRIAERSADAATATTGGAIWFGLTIGEVNQYLQALAFLVAIVSGSCAAFYYIRKASAK